MKLIWTIAVFLLVPLVSANQNLSEEYICDKTFYYLIENPNSENPFKLKSILDPEISIKDLEPYLLDYENKCPNGKKLPFKDLEIPVLDSSNSSGCVYKINKTVIFGSVDLDSSLEAKIINFHLENPSCKKVEVMRWFISIHKTENGYYLKGLKTWFFMFFLGMIIIVSLIKSTRLTNRTAENYNKMAEASLRKHNE